MIVEIMTKRVIFERVQYLKIPNNRDKYIVYKPVETLAITEIEQ